jgi:hypothetical protein
MMQNLVSISVERSADMTHGKEFLNLRDRRRCPGIREAGRHRADVVDLSVPSKRVQIAPVTHRLIVYRVSFASSFTGK